MSHEFAIATTLSFLALSLFGAERDAKTPSKLVCVGRVEPVQGEVEVSAQMPGTLISVCVHEGQWVTNGTILAEVDARKEKAAHDVAIAKLRRLKAGNGKEEIEAASAACEAIEAELVFAEADYKRATKLREDRVFAEEELDRRRQRAEALRKQLASAQKHASAVKRGPLPEDIVLAEAEVAAAKAAYDLRLIRAEFAGTILHLYRHTGDTVSLSFPSPILRLANNRELRVRIEVSENDVYRVSEGMRGAFTTFGARNTTGSLVVRTILPSFAARRLFEPDSTARMDTRTMQVLCEIEGDAKIYSGQRVTATFVAE